MTETTKFEGYCDDLTTLPVKRGDNVVIPKGTRCTSTNGKRREFVTGRTYTVKVHSIGCGQNWPVGHPNHDKTYPVRNPSVTWVGTGGYWTECDINDVKLVAK